MISLQRLFDCLSFLREHEYKPKVGQWRPDAITITLVFPGIRAEIDFFADRVEYRYFVGSEEPMTDRDALYEIARTGVVPADLAERKERSRSVDSRVTPAGEAAPNRLLDLLHFLDLLEREKIVYRVERQMSDTPMIFFARPQMRVEVDFFAEDDFGDEIWFSVFTGREESQGGEDELRAFILQCEDPEFRRWLEAADVADGK